MNRYDGMISRLVMRFAWRMLILVWFVFYSPWLYAQTPPESVTLKDCLAISRVGETGRNPIHRDAVEAQIVAGKWTSPREGTVVELPSGATQTWKALKADEEGFFSGRNLSGGYAYFSIPSGRDKIALLDASGHNMVYINGIPRTGDRYGLGITLLPIHLRAGSNDLLFLSGRGRLRIKLIDPSSYALLNLRDNTLPDGIAGEALDSWGAAVVINASTQPLSGLSLWVTGNGLQSTLTPVSSLLPLGIRKAAFRLLAPALQEEGTLEAEIKLVKEENRGLTVLDSGKIQIGVRRPGQSAKITFLSEIDGSVQYYAVQPAQSSGCAKERPALILSLHGAGVEAIGQANAYSPKTWGTIVAPTNRRPYGFDWEDWGRMDALEVLQLARERFDTDPQRTYLTGHSMGGHGTWQIGALFPGCFAAIAPSAGWCSFGSYAQPRTRDATSPLGDLMQRSAALSDTMNFSRNYLQQGVYILHGDTDDNVPVSEARNMKEHLREFHRNLDWHEQPGAGHWWDVSEEPGADCVDWLPIFQFFARQRIPDCGELLSLEFTTANPGVSARLHWLEILTQERALLPSSVSIRCEPGRNVFSGTTRNVAGLHLSLSDLPVHSPVRIELDGDTLADVSFSSGEPHLNLQKSEGHWSVVSRPDPAQKGPHRYGPFKEAFRHRMTFVYGTKGTDEENAWVLAKARLDAEEFWYRGNGSIDVISDEEFQVESNAGRNVILYGNADTNRVWNALLPESPVQMGRGYVRIGERRIEGETMACLFVRPRANSEINCVAVVGGSGIAGMRLCDRLPYFVSGVGYPDCLVLDSAVLTHGNEGIRAAGFFGMDWSVAGGEFLWRE